MRYLVILALVLGQVPPASADDACAYGSPTPYAKVLTKEELEAVLANRPGSDVVLREAAAGSMAPPRSRSPHSPKHHTSEITPEQAERLIVLGTIRTVDVYHNGFAVLMSRTKHVYHVRKASEELLLKVVGAVDPCHVFISVSLE